MKIKNVLLLTSIAFLASGCGLFLRPSTSKSSSSALSSITSTTTGTSTTKTSSTSQSNKVTVPAHTLSDSNPPIDVSAKGQQVNETTWNSFRNASDSKFVGNYNYTYSAWSGGNHTLEEFTKNGYHMKSNAGELYYERKSGSTFYTYIKQSNYTYLREEATLDIQSKYTSRITSEIYVHMFDYSNYEYDSDEGSYYYRTTSFGCTVKFQGGYLTYLQYALGTNIFEIKATFETTINIPESYYYK